MSDKNPSEPRCADCGARWAQLDDDGLCQACFVARGFRSAAEMLQLGARPNEPHHEPVTGRRLAEIIATAAAQMAESERLMLWVECHQIFGDKLDKDTHPELVRVIETLHDPVSNESRAAKWN